MCDYHRRIYIRHKHGSDSRYAIADLPETILDSVSKKHKLTMYLPHLNFNHSVDHCKGLEGRWHLAFIHVLAPKCNLASKVTA